MEIRLNSLTLKNFKKFKSFTVNFDGKDCEIYGDNRTGKTTIYDAFMWLLFGKDSKGRTDFTVKTIGVERPEVEVTGVLSIDGKPVEFKKVLREKWIAKRGSDEETFSGNETICYINGVEKPVSEYKAYLDMLVSEETFKRLTSASYFLSLKKADMRKVLVEMAGDCDTNTIVAEHPELQELIEYLNAKGISAEDCLKLAKQNLTLYNAENDKISVRIDEVNRSMPEEPEGGWEEVENALLQAKERIRLVDEKLGSIYLAKLEVKKAQGEIYALENKIRDYKRQKLDEANKEALRIKTALESANNVLRNLQTKLDGLRYDKNIKNKMLSDLYKRLKEQGERYEELLSELKKAAEESFIEPEIDAKVCALCGQPLPESMLKEQAEKARTLFEAEKKKKIEKLTAEKDQVEAEGIETRKKFEELKAQIESLEKEIASVEADIVIANATIEELKEKSLIYVVSDDIDLAADEEYQSMLKQLQEMKDNLEEPKDQSEELLAYKAKMEGYVEQLNSILNRREQIKQCKARIIELTERGKELAGLIAIEKKRQLLCERFISVRADYLSEKINSLFDFVKFRLFDRQINGAIVDDCTPMVQTENGLVELTRDASNSEQINAGLDIVKAMQKVQNVFVPVFIDNAEAATSIISMPCQVIKLIVSENDKKLRVEI